MHVASDLLDAIEIGAVRWQKFEPQRAAHRLQDALGKLALVDDVVVGEDPWVIRVILEKAG